MPESLKPFIGIGGVIVFVVILVLCIMADKNTNKKFLKKISENYKAKDKCGKHLFITGKNEVMLEYGSGTLSGYKLWNLEDIAYVGISRVKLTQTSFCFMDENKKAMKASEQ